jgi:hypothetical protein
MDSTLIVQPQWSFSLGTVAAFLGAFLLLLALFSWLDRRRSEASFRGAETTASDVEKDHPGDVSRARTSPFDREGGP